ncbi:LysM domain-containing protein, partial [Streptomyces sp. WAC05950]
PPTDPTAPTTPPVTPSPSPTDPTAPVAPTTPANPATPGATPAEGNGKHRGAPSPEEGTPSDAAAAPVYTVQAGDSLATIAVAKGVKGGWSGLYEANEQVIGEDADLIKPGQNLDLTT